MNQAFFTKICRTILRHFFLWVKKRGRKGFWRDFLSSFQKHSKIVFAVKKLAFSLTPGWKMKRFRVLQPKSSKSSCGGKRENRRMGKINCKGKQNGSIFETELYPNGDISVIYKILVIFSKPLRLGNQLGEHKRRGKRGGNTQKNRTTGFHKEKNEQIKRHRN